MVTPMPPLTPVESSIRVTGSCSLPTTLTFRLASQYFCGLPGCVTIASDERAQIIDADPEIDNGTSQAIYAGPYQLPTERNCPPAPDFTCSGGAYSSCDGSVEMGPIPGFTRRATVDHKSSNVPSIL